MSAIDADIDRLYQVPISEFTAARNTLAARAGSHKAAIKALQKPNIAAWAVNQLHWQRRAVYDRLVGASTALRKAQVAAIAGRNADVSGAEQAHEEALRDAFTAIKDVAGKAGETLSPQVTVDIHETLRALPGEETPGRLVRPLKPMGFQALLKMLPGLPAAAAKGEATRAQLRALEPAERESTAAAEHTAPATKADRVVAIDERRREREAAEQAKRAESERRRERALLERDLAATRDEERVRSAAVTKMQAALASAERELARRQTSVEQQQSVVRDARDALRSAEQAVKQTADARAALEHALRTATKRR